MQLIPTPKGSIQQRFPIYIGAEMSSTSNFATIGLIALELYW